MAAASPSIPHRTLDHDRRWLSHHGPEHTERCCSVRGVAVCRRCAVLYPVAVAAAVGTVLVSPPMSVAVALMWLLPVPMMLDWVAEHLRAVRYSPVRQVVVTAVAAPALGIALGLHATDPFTLAAVAPMATWTVVALVSAWWARRRTAATHGGDASGWEARHLAEEAARRSELEAMLAAADHVGDHAGRAS